MQHLSSSPPPPSLLQVSELSHKLGSAEGAKRSLEEEAARLQAAHKAASQQRHDLDIQLNEAKAKLIALEEKVGGGWGRVQGTRCSSTGTAPAGSSTEGLPRADPILSPWRVLLR